jgi:hypothetical protein
VLSTPRSKHVTNHTRSCFSGETSGEEPLGRPRRRWEDNIKMDLTKVERGGARTGSIWFRIGTLLNAVMHLRFP